jgi:aspartate-semialdehyde dehydrogenase
MVMKVAVVGATGAVGREMARILVERRFPVDEFVPLASSRSAGTQVDFAGESHVVRELSLDGLRGVDVALVSAGAAISRSFMPQAAEMGVTCIDNSSAFRMEPGVPLSIPEVNPDALRGSPRMVAVPNCTTITVLLAVAPLHRAAGLTSLVLSSYQSVSGAGQRGVDELLAQVEKLRGDERSLARPVHEALPVGDLFGATIAYNVVAKIGEFEEDGYTGEESKMMAEPRKILDLPDLPVAATSVRVPVIVGHGVSILAEFAQPLSVAQAREAIAAAPGVELRDDPANGIYPSPLDAAGLDVALAGRIRQVRGRTNALELFSCTDNLRKGAALDAVQVAEHLFTR